MRNILALCLIAVVLTMSNNASVTNDTKQKEVSSQSEPQEVPPAEMASRIEFRRSPEGEWIDSESGESFNQIINAFFSQDEDEKPEASKEPEKVTKF